MNDVVQSLFVPYNSSPLSSVTYTISQNGLAVRLQSTDLGLIVEFDCWKVTVSVSSVHVAQTAGLCGNNDGQVVNDWRLSSGLEVDSSNQNAAGRLIGDSWVVRFPDEPLVFSKDIVNNYRREVSL